MLKKSIIAIFSLMILTSLTACTTRGVGEDIQAGGKDHSAQRGIIRSPPGGVPRAEGRRISSSCLSVNAAAILPQCG